MLHGCYNKKYKSEHRDLHYRIVYELFRDIVILQDRIKELEEEIKQKNKQ